MNVDEFIASIEKTYNDSIALIKIKNKDYAGGANVNPWKNFEFIAYALRGLDLNACDLVEVGIFTRMLDKCARISSLLASDPAVVSESMGDTLKDLANYSVILKTYRENKIKEAVKQQSKD